MLHAILTSVIGFLSRGMSSLRFLCWFSVMKWKTVLSHTSPVISRADPATSRRALSALDRHRIERLYLRPTTRLDEIRGDCTRRSAAAASDRVIADIQTPKRTPTIKCQPRSNATPLVRWSSAQTRCSPRHHKFLRDLSRVDLPHSRIPHSRIRSRIATRTCENGNLCPFYLAHVVKPAVRLIPKYLSTYLPTYLPTLRHKGRRYWGPRQGGRAAGGPQGPRGRLASSTQLAFLLSNARHESLGSVRGFVITERAILLRISSDFLLARLVLQPHRKTTSCSLLVNLPNASCDQREVIKSASPNGSSEKMPHALCPLSGNLNKSTIRLRI